MIEGLTKCVATIVSLPTVDPPYACLPGEIPNGFDEAGNPICEELPTCSRNGEVFDYDEGLCVCPQEGEAYSSSSEERCVSTTCSRNGEVFDYDDGLCACPQEGEAYSSSEERCVSTTCSRNGEVFDSDEGLCACPQEGEAYSNSSRRGVYQQLVVAMVKFSTYDEGLCACPQEGEAYSNSSRIGVYQQLVVAMVKFSTMTKVSVPVPKKERLIVDLLRRGVYQQLVVSLVKSFDTDEGLCVCPQGEVYSSVFIVRCVSTNLPRLFSAIKGIIQLLTKVAVPVPKDAVFSVNQRVMCVSTICASDLIDQGYEFNSRRRSLYLSHWRSFIVSIIVYVYINNLPRRRQQ